MSKFAFATTNLGTGATAAQIVLPGYSTFASTTKVQGTKRSLEAKPLIKCEGAFCHSLAGQGFEFVEIEVPAKPTPVEYVGVSNGSGAEPPEQTAVPAATLHVLV